MAGGRVSKWKHDTEEGWRRRVEVEAKRLSLQISQGQIDGPDIAAVIEALVLKASERKPERIER
jgi:hypothetical protein